MTSLAAQPIDHDVLIVGAGFSGIGAARELDRVGISDYLIVEQGEGFGGTWYWNRYPGIAVDIPSFSYQYSYAKSAEWTRTYAPGAELRDYAETCAGASAWPGEPASPPGSPGPASTRPPTCGACRPTRARSSPAGT